MSETTDRVREFWDLDADSYEHTAGHNARSRAELAAWRATLRRLLPAPPATVLDVGAGTGFVTVLLAELGFRVTALDLSPRMLDRLRTQVHARGLDVTVVEGDAVDPPAGPFDVVIERHVTWTLQAPDEALAAWLTVAPGGRLVLLESRWGAAADRGEEVKAHARTVLARLRGQPAPHHADYAEDLRAALPLGAGTRIERLLALVAASGWGPPRLHRLPDVDWAARAALPWPERLLGVTPRYAVLAGR